MLKQFRASYPQGSLISELVIIDRGKYLVRTLVQVEGITLATGLAAADTVEQAEDRSRQRALVALNLSALPRTQMRTSGGAKDNSVSQGAEFVQQPVKPSHADASESSISLNLDSANGESEDSAEQLPSSQNQSTMSELPPEELGLHKASPDQMPMPVNTKAASQEYTDEVGSKGSSFNTDVSELESSTRTDSVPASAQAQEPLPFSSPDSFSESQPTQTSVSTDNSSPLDPLLEKSQERSEPIHGTQNSEFPWATSDRGADISFTEPAIASSSGSSSSAPVPEGQPPVTSATDYSFGLSQERPSEPPADEPPKANGVQTPLSGPIDFSDIIAKTNVEMKRLGWTSEQGRKYLLETYGKRSRQLLSDEELLDFLHHLESLPAS